MKEWRKLTPTVKGQFKKKLAERLEGPKVSADKLATMSGCYKIKLSSLGYRLVYRVVDEQVQVVVIAVGKRERSKVYKIAQKRLTAEEELKSDWLLEARRRGEELDNGTVQAVSGDEVMRNARALIK